MNKQQLADERAFEKHFKLSEKDAKGDGEIIQDYEFNFDGYKWHIDMRKPYKENKWVVKTYGDTGHITIRQTGDFKTCKETYKQLFLKAQETQRFEKRKKRKLTMKTYTLHYPKEYNDNIEGWSIFVSHTTYRADIWVRPDYYHINLYVGQWKKTCDIDGWQFDYCENNGRAKKISSRTVLKMAKAMLIALVEQKTNRKSK